MKSIYILLLMVIGLWPQITHAQESSSSPVFIHHDVTDGLAGNSIYDVICDQKGQIWVATNRGITCYDGARYRTYTTRDGLLENKAIKLFMDGHGTIWCMGYQSQVSYFDNGQFHPYQYNEVLKDSLDSDRTLLNFAITDGGDLYIVFQKRDHRLVHIDPKGKIDFGIEGRNDRHVLLLEVGKKILIHLTEEPYWSKRKYPALKDHFWIQQAGFPAKKLECNTTTSICAGRRLEQVIRLQDGRLLVNSRRGLFAQLEVDGEVEMLSDKRSITALIQDSDGWIWEGRYENGIFIYHPDDLFHPRYHWLPNFEIGAITEDKEGGVWIGTGNRGLYHIPQKRIMRKKHKNEALILSTKDLEGNEMALYTGGKVIYRPVDSEVERNITEELDTKAYLIRRSENKRFFVLSSVSGSYLLDPASPILKKIFKGPFSSFMDGRLVSDSLLHFRAANMIVRVDRSGKVTKLIPGVRFFGGVADGKGNWYLNSFAGLYRWPEGETGNIEKVFPKEGNLEVGMGYFRGDTMVTGTQGSGLLVITPDTFYTIGTQEGLPTNFINGTKPLIDGRIGMATEKGFSVINLPYRKEDAVHFSTRNGLEQNDVYGFNVTGDSLRLFDVKNSFSISMDDLPERMPSAKKPELSGWIGDSLIESAHPEFPYTMNQAAFKFKTVSLQHQAYYRYQLLGHEDKWIETDRGEAYFGNLQSGKYIFRVQARFEHEDWPQEAVELTFEIKPPFWVTWWFLTLVIIALGTIIYLFVRYLIRRIRKQAAARQKMLALKNEALRSQMNPHFTFNALNSIQSYITVNDKKSAANFLADFAAMMRSFLEHSREDFVCLEDEKTLLQRYMELEQLRFPGQFSFQIEFDSDLEEDMDEIPAMLIQPLVENAIIHGVQASRNTTRILVRFDRISDTLLRCRVINDGVELESKKDKENHQSIGLQILHERLDNLKAAGMGEGTLRLFPAREVEGWDGGVCAELALPYRHGA